MKWEPKWTASTRKNMLLVVLVVACVTLYILISNISLPPHVQQLKSGSWVPYQYQRFRDKAWFEKVCLNGQKSAPLLEKLPVVLKQWKTSINPDCRTLYTVFTSLFTVNFQTGHVKIPDEFVKKVKSWLGNKEELFDEVNNQSIVTVYNEYTMEHNTYNPIRSKRPMAVPEQPERQYVEELSQKTGKNCDFCNYRQFTAADTWGRIDNRLSYSASNTFKLDHWHGLFMLKTHHPLHWNLTQFLDWMDTRQKWFRKTHSLDRSYIYPSMIWDLLPHGGASQVHPHIHGFLDSKGYQGPMEVWRRAAADYTRDFPGRNYFNDLVQVHALLGLTVTYGKAVAFANLVPRKDNEIVIVSEKDDRDFHMLWYLITRGYLDDMQNLCFSGGIALPSMSGDKSSKSLPVYARIVTRGAVADVRSDFSSLELFTASNANTDPYKLIKNMKKSVEKRSWSSR